ncbi:carboxypeptidase-like regulatory domain-containing protein [Flavobacterium pedocola]
MKPIFYIPFFLFSFFSFGQERIVSGKVTDETGNPIYGAGILIDRSKGTTTDFDGKYSLSAKPSDTLVFNFIGMKTQKIAATKNVIDVKLIYEENLLKEEFGPPIRPPKRNPISSPAREITAEEIKNTDKPKGRSK